MPRPESFIDLHRYRVNDQGRRLLVKDGSLSARDIVTCAGWLEVSQGRVRDNAEDPNDRVQFAPKVLPA